MKFHNFPRHGRAIILAGLIALVVISPIRLFGATLTGDFGAHDPSRITKCSGKYFIYLTGPNCPMLSSTNLLHWARGPAVLNGVPAWAHQAVPKADSEFIWAPDVIYFNNQYYLFYSFSTFGSRVSVIGLVTSPTLDPTLPNYHWSDRGEVIGSGNGDNYNAIDPCPILDAQGNLWLSFGSWNRGGIQLVKLDKDTNKPVSMPIPIVAGQRTGPEGSFLYFRAGYYYVFENEGLCCQGLNSTYRIMMGRSPSLTGPYVDKRGRELTRGGGTLFMGTDGAEFGPGQIGIFREGGIDRLTFHYYSGMGNGIPLLGLERLTWDADGWPRPNPNPPPPDTLEGHYQIVSRATGLALGVQGDDAKDGALMNQGAYTGSPMQQWNVSPTGDGYYSLSSLGDAKFLDLFQCNPRDGTPIDQYPWLNNDCQRWRLDKSPDGSYRITAKGGGGVVTVPGGVKTPQALIQEFAWSGGDNQKWIFKRL